MKNLFHVINATTDKNQAKGDASISHASFMGGEFNTGNGEFTNEVCEQLDISPSDFDCFYDGVDVVESALSSSYPGETVYFWID